MVAIGETPRKSDVGREHRLHLVLIARKDNQHVGIGLGENGEQRVEYTTSEVFLVIGTCDQRIGLIDEEHVALGFFEDGFHVILRLTDILSHQSGAIDGDDLTFGEEPESMIDLAKLTGDGGFACTGIAREDRVVSLFTAVVQSSFPAFQEEAALISHRMDALFHLVKSHHRIEFTDALFVGRGGRGELVERDVLLIKQRPNAISIRQEHTSEITREDLFLNELSDLEGGPAGDGTFLAAFDDGTCEMVFCLQAEFKVLFLHLGQEGLNKFVRCTGLLLNPTVGLKELFQRGGDIQELFDLTACAAEPDERLITRAA